MSPLHPPRSLELPDYWTPEQALAVFELLADLERRIWDRYECQLFELLRPDLDEPEDAQLDLFDFDDSLPF